MLIIGLTGSIGMGKSTAAARFRADGIGVLDADAVVHELYRGAAVPLVEAAFPGTTRDGGIDRVRLLAAITATADGFARLEAIVHPLVRQAEREFLRSEHARGAELVVLEIPLLFETGADRLVDATIVVSAPAALQRQRVLARPGMTDAKLAEISSRQMADAAKRARADYVVDTSGEIADAEAQIARILLALKGRAGSAYHRCWSSA